MDGILYAFQEQTSDDNQVVPLALCLFLKNFKKLDPLDKFQSGDSTQVFFPRPSGKGLWVIMGQRLFVSWWFQQVLLEYSAAPFWRHSG